MFENYAVLWDSIAQRRPDRPAIATADRTITYGELEQQASSVAAWLGDRGVSAGSRVAFFLHNTPEYIVALYACLKLEAVPVSLNYRYRGTEVAELLRVCEPDVLLCATTGVAVAQDALREVTGTSACPRSVVVIDGDQETRQDDVEWVPFDVVAAHPPAPLPPPSRDAELYIFTGGTTGTPKAVVWGIGDLLHIQQSSIYPPAGLQPPDTVEEAVELAIEGDVPRVTVLPLAPFIHATALFNAMNALVLGGTIVIFPRPSLDTREVVELLMSNDVTRLIIAGDAVAVPLLAELEQQLAGRESTLRSVISSGMRFSDETKRAFHRLGDVTIVDILASTEGGPYAMATTSREEELPARFRLTEDAVVLDADDREVQDRPGATGVLAYRGALPKGYLNDPEKTAESYPMINGVRHVRPGDYVRVEEDRFIEFLGRGSSVVNTGGEKVFPAEVEEVLLAHPAVTDAVVFGLPDERWGEQVAATVSVAAGAEVTEQELIDHVGRHLAGYKKPRTLIIEGSLERTPTGKLNMRAVKASALDRAAGRGDGR